MSDVTAVIGAGVVGLTTAVELLRRGGRVRVYTSGAGLTPASAVAPAMFTPYAGPSIERFRRWTAHSLDRLRELAAEAPESGVSVGELREFFYAPPRPDAWLDALLGVREIEAPAPCVHAITSNRPHIDMLRYIPWLRAQAISGGGEIVTRDVASLEEILREGHRAVINCAGLGARRLTRDPLLRAMHGQVAHVPNDIGLEWSVHDDAPGGLVAYIFRFADRLVVGGTFDSGDEARGTDEATLAGILDRSRELLRLAGFARWEDLGRRIIEARAAARPVRGQAGATEDIRVEREDRSGGRVIHNYGHGRAGVTLSWATAADAAELAMGGE